MATDSASSWGLVIERSSAHSPLSPGSCPARHPLAPNRFWSQAGVPQSAPKADFRSILAVTPSTREHEGWSRDGVRDRKDVWRKVERTQVREPWSQGSSPEGDFLLPPVLPRACIQQMGTEIHSYGPWAIKLLLPVPRVRLTPSQNREKEKVESRAHERHGHGVTRRCRRSSVMGV